MIYFLFGDRRALIVFVGVTRRTPWETLQQLEERVRRALAESSFACWGYHRGGGRAVGQLNPDVKVALEGAEPPRFAGDVSSQKMDMSNS